MPRTRTVITALTLVSVLALGACSDDDPEPKFAPTPSTGTPTPPTTTAASAPTEPTMPAAANGTDAASAEAFVKFYWEMVNYAQATGDLRQLKALASIHCVACRKGVKGLHDVFADGGKIIGGGGTVAVRKTTFLNEDGQSSAVVEFDVSSARQRVDYPGERKDEFVPAGTVALRAVLDPSGEGWTMAYWDQQ